MEADICETSNHWLFSQRSGEGWQSRFSRICYASLIMQLKMTFVLIIAGWLLVTVCVMEGNSERYFTFSSDISEPHAYTVLEGETVHLICHQDNTDEVQVWGNNINYVTGGELDQESPDNAEFTRNVTTGVLSIIHVTRNNGDTFICRRPKAKYLDLKVIYSPSQEYPRCTSNYGRHVFFDGELQEPFQFNCSTEKADPNVDTILFIDKAGRKRQVETSDLNVHEHHRSKTLSFTPYLDSSFDNSSLICRVTQQLPAPYQNYKGSCSFGPLMMLLPTFSVSIHQSHYKVNTNKRENITLTCTSNVSGVVLEWTDIPLSDWQYNVIKFKDSLQLKIFDYESSTDGSITFQCSGSYGGGNIFNHASVNFVRSHHFDLLHLMMLVLSCIIIVLVTLLLRLNYRRCLCRLAPSSSSSSSSSAHAIGQFPRSNTTYTTTIRPESINVSQHQTNVDDPQVYAHSITLNQNTEEEAAKYTDISEDSKYNYDRQLYLVPSQTM